MLDESKRFDYAKDSITQVISLAAGILAVSLTFSKNWTSGASHIWKHVLQVSWLLFLASAVCGVFSLHVITGLASSRLPSLKDSILRVPWMGQLLFFVGGLILLVLFGFASV